jgi:hypothetical protein
MALYIDEQYRAFLQALEDGEFDEWDEEDEEEDENLEATLRDFNDAVCEVGY